jgi:hypothetical protein
VPKAVIEKKPIKVTPLSNDPGLQMALKMHKNQINETNSESDEL